MTAANDFERVNAIGRQVGRLIADALKDVEKEDCSQMAASIILIAAQDNPCISTSVTDFLEKEITKHGERRLRAEKFIADAGIEELVELDHDWDKARPIAEETWNLWRQRLGVLKREKATSMVAAIIYLAVDKIEEVDPGMFEVVIELLSSRRDDFEKIH